MNLRFLTPDLVRAIHDRVLNPGELTGEAKDKSLEGALSLVDNRIAYGMIVDVFDLAATYAMAISTGHCFNDGNKRTAYHAMETCLDINGVTIAWDMLEIGPRIIALAQGKLEAEDLADWLRDTARA
jgi:death-on-curing protein